MSRFYGSMGAGGNESTRCTGLSAHVRGWQLGASARMSCTEDGEDQVSIFLTSGSAGHSGDQLIGSFRKGDKVKAWAKLYVIMKQQGLLTTPYLVTTDIDECLEQFQELYNEVASKRVTVMVRPGSYMYYTLPGETQEVRYTIIGLDLPAGSWYHIAKGELN